jgi:putative Mg2+ transporter-C (MgtC) family protein
MIQIDWTVIERLLIVFVLASAYGLERQQTHKPVGFGTFILVSMGAAGLGLAAEQIGLDIGVSILGAIVTGIGFLGAGALIRTSDRIFGFTTAASIWLFAIFGLLIGLGMYEIGITIYILVWVVVFVDRQLERRFIGSYKREVSITTVGFVNKDEIANILAKYCKNFKLLKIDANRKEKRVLLKYLVIGLKKDIDSLLKEFYNNKWCISIELGS